MPHALKNSEKGQDFFQAVDMRNSVLMDHPMIAPWLATVVLFSKLPSGT
jgi:hypothetical protein